MNFLVNFCFRKPKTVLTIILVLFLYCSFICLPLNLIFPAKHLLGEPRLKLTEKLFQEGKSIEHFTEHIKDWDFSPFLPLLNCKSEGDLKISLNKLIDGKNLFNSASEQWEQYFEQVPKRLKNVRQLKLIKNYILKSLLRPAELKRLNRYLIDFFFLDIIRPAQYWPASQVGLEINSSMARMFLDGDPEREVYTKYKKHFGDDEICVIALKSENIFSTPFIKKLTALTGEIENIPGVDEVVSMTNVQNIVGSEGGFEVSPLMAEIPRTPEQLKKLKSDLFAKDIYLGTLISRDAKTTAINAFFQVRPDSDWRYKQLIVKEIQKKVKAKFSDNEVQESFVAGMAPFTVDLHQFMLEDIVLFFALTFALIMFILWVTFMSIRGVLLPMLSVGITVVLSHGFIVLIGSSISLVTTIVPSMLIAVCSSYSIHYVTHYYQLIDSPLEGEALTARLVEGLQKVCWPILISGLTTFAGFISLTANPVNTIREFGLFFSAGIAIGVFITLTFIPAALGLLEQPPLLMDENYGVSRFLSPTRLLHFGNWVCDHPRQIIVFFVIILLLCLAGASRLHVMTEYYSFFQPTDPLPTSVRFIRENLSGEFPLLLMVDSGHQDGCKNPDFLKKVETLQNFAENYKTTNDPERRSGVPLIAQTLTFGDYLKNMNRAMHEDRKEMEILPKSSAMISQYMLIYGNKREIWRYVTEDYRLVSVFLRSAITRSDDVMRFARELRAKAKQLFADNPEVTYHVTSSQYLLIKSAEAISYGQIKSLCIATLVIFIIILLVFMDLKIAIISFFPNALPIVFNFGMMGFLGVPINTGTSIVASVALGIAVDDTIHLLTQFKREYKESEDGRNAVVRSLQHCSKGVIFTSVSLFFGFLILCFSHFTPIQAIGCLTAMTMFVALIADLFLTPAILFLCYKEKEQVQIEGDL
ncbi:RND family transporter [Candidatus Riflebacteria bacterium]